MGNSNASRRQRALVAIGLAVMTMSLAVLATGAKGCDESDGKESAAGSALTVLSVTTSQLPVARLEQPWAGVLEAAGGTAPYQWSVATLPGWMQLDASQGVLWGMVPASAAGSPVISVTVTDAVNDTATRDLTLVYTSTPAAQLPISLVSVADHSDGHFRTHTVCANCHSNAGGASAMRDSMNRDLGPVNLWRGTMMANSFRDPYFRAVLAAEKEHHPNLAATIEDTCLTCHAPQAAYEAHQQGATQTLSELYTGATSRAQIGLDGVSCSTCHQIEATGLGTPATYTAKFQIAPSKVAYARHANPFANPMVNNSGYTPTQASHTSQSKMCASCHTLHTPVVDLANNLTTATFPEQAPYYEWRNSIYSTEVASPGASAQDCQGCHMPSLSQDGVAINTRIARRPAGDDFPPISPRQPFSRHSMLGANTIMLSILRDHAGDLNSPASTAEFNHLIDRNRDFLRNSTGDVTVQNLALNSGTLSFDVKVENHTGHKFPTSYLSRRAWLRVLVKDAGGNTVWRSGDYDNAGRLVDGNGQPLASEAAHGPIQPHRQTVTQQQEVQVYEAVSSDVSGQVNFSLLFAAGYYKDNRVLPQGWSNTHADIDNMRPVGTAGDSDYIGGSDTVHYQAAGLGAGPYTVEVQLLYQTISAREANEVFLHDTLREVNVFRQYYEAAPRTPELIAETSQTTP